MLYQTGCSSKSVGSYPFFSALSDRSIAGVLGQHCHVRNVAPFRVFVPKSVSSSHLARSYIHLTLRCRSLLGAVVASQQEVLHSSAERTPWAICHTLCSIAAAIGTVLLLCACRSRCASKNGHGKPARATHIICRRWTAGVERMLLFPEPYHTLCSLVIAGGFRSEPQHADAGA